MESRETVTTIRPEATTEDTTGRLLLSQFQKNVQTGPNTLSTVDITTGSQEMKKTLLITRWTGLTAGTSAESTAWTWSAWRHHQNTSLSRSLSRTMISPMSGHQADSATSRAVTERTCSHQQLTDGSGQAPVSRWPPP